jgi:hypothetical protein
VSKLVHKCPACSRRVKRAPLVTMKHKRTRKERCFHGSPECLEAAALFVSQHAPEEITISYYHPGACGDARGRFDCPGGCFRTDAAEPAA